MEVMANRVALDALIATPIRIRQYPAGHQAFMEITLVEVEMQLPYWMAADGVMDRILTLLLPH
jgi:hypothetical protein